MLQSEDLLLKAKISEQSDKVNFDIKITATNSKPS